MKGINGVEVDDHRTQRIRAVRRDENGNLYMGYPSAKRYGTFCKFSCVRDHEMAFRDRYPFMSGDFLLIHEKQPVPVSAMVDHFGAKDFFTLWSADWRSEEEIEDTRKRWAARRAERMASGFAPAVVAKAARGRL